MSETREQNKATETNQLVYKRQNWYSSRSVVLVQIAFHFHEVIRDRRKHKTQYKHLKTQPKHKDFITIAIADPCARVAADFKSTREQNEAIDINQLVYKRQNWYSSSSVLIVVSFS